MGGVREMGSGKENGRGKQKRDKWGDHYYVQHVAKYSSYYIQRKKIKGYIILASYIE